MTNFYSALIINSKSFPSVHQVFKPRYNREFFKRVTANINQLEIHIDKRCKNPHANLGKAHLANLNDSAKQLVKLNERLDKFAEDETQSAKILAQIESIEDKIMPTVIRIPNRLSKSVPSADQILDEYQTNFMTEQKLTKILSHRKLSYINNCYSKSVVGPNSHYYYGIGAKLQHAISNYFISELESDNFVAVSGPSLVKSAVVEAVNSSDVKEFHNDPARILNESHKYTAFHLSEASRESLVSLITTFGHMATNNPLRLLTCGAAYRLGSDWFDGDDRKITQFETAHALILNSSIEQYSMREYLRFKDVIWSSYKKLELPVRLVHCSQESMLSNEYDAHRVDIWLPSRQDWLQVCRISNYLDYITVRVGLRRGHLIDSTVFDGQVLTAAIIENKQTALGKFIIPSALEEHTMHLTDAEKQSYFMQPSTSSATKVASVATPTATEKTAAIADTSVTPIASTTPIATATSALTAAAFIAAPLQNYVQKRYLRKMDHPFGHSRKASSLKALVDGQRDKRLLIGMFLFIYLLIDWDDFWLDYVPDFVRSFTYDYMYRPIRRCWWYLVYEEGKQPPDLTFAELDKSLYETTMWERRKAHARSERELPEEVRKARAEQEAREAQGAMATSHKEPGGEKNK